MSPWKCAGCHCEYQWTEPVEKQGYKFCGGCADDPDKLRVAQASFGRVSGGWWFALGILLGMMFAKILFCNNH